MADIFSWKVTRTELLKNYETCVRHQITIEDAIFFLKEIEKALDEKNSWVRANARNIALKLNEATRDSTQSSNSLKTQTLGLSASITSNDIIDFLKQEALTYTIASSFNVSFELLGAY